MRKEFYNLKIIIIKKRQDTQAVFNITTIQL
jgi:hypothetical protein